MAAAPISQEVRIALVMNGGVSLAVWMAGVTHEIDLLRRASAGGDDVPADVPGYDRAVWAQWKQAAGPRQVLVDIVAGTSAGGLNGALLASTIARGGRLDWADENREMPFLRRLWQEKAGLEFGQLVPEPDDPRRSLLDGNYFEQIVRTTLDQLAQEARRHAAEVAAPTVTLFVPATALGPADRRFRDGFGQPFLTEDHRRLYRFRHDPGRVRYDGEPGRFSPDGAREFRDFDDELVRAARASASYPVAFEPVEEMAKLAGPPLLALGTPAPPSDTPRAAWLADGGILDNAPFGPVLDGIARRAPDAAVDRLLIYVVPSRGTRSAGHGATAGKAAESDGAPPWLTVAQSGLFLPREADFRSDIDAVDDLLRAADTEGQAVRLFAAAIGDPGTASGVIGAAEGLLDTYWRGRCSSALREVRALAGGPGRADTTDLIGYQDRSAAPAWPQPAFGPDQALLDEPWEWSLSAAERCVRLFARDLMSRLRAEQDVTEAAQTVSVVLRQIEALGDALAGRLAEAPPEAVATDDGAVTVMTDAAGDLSLAEATRRCLETAATAYSAGLDGIGVPVSAQDAMRLALAVDICARALQTGAPYRRTPLFRFLRLGPDVDAPIIDLPGTELGDRKLYGSRASHFAAFGRSEWRAHDWLWGRLDAIAHLGAALGQTREWIEATQEAVLAGDGADPTFRKLPDLRTRTMALLHMDDPKALMRAITETEDGKRVIEELESRAARMAADEFDIPWVPEFAEILLVRRLLRRAIGA